MTITFGELKRRILVRFDSVSGKDILAIEEAINSAHMWVARVQDFDDLMVLDTTNAVTVAHQKLYHLETDLKLVRPKDIYSIRYMDGVESRKLVFVPIRKLDEVIPYTEMSGEGKPKWYTQRGKYLEFYRVPSEAKPLYIMHSQWPITLVNDGDESPYLNLEDVLVTLGTEIAQATLEGGASGNWFQRAKALLGMAVSETDTRPDVALVAQPFNPRGTGLSGEYWNNPFIKKGN